MPAHPHYPTIDDQGRITAASRLAALIFVIVLPTAATVLAVTLLVVGAVSSADLWIFAGMYVATGLGLTVGYHRLITHRSFQTYKPVRYLLVVLGGMAAEGAPIIWASQHRRHHAFADREGDPHSPRVGRPPGLLGWVKGLWHSHYGHVFHQVSRIEPERYARDLAEERFLRILERCAIVPAIAGFVVPFAIGYAVTYTWAGAWTGLLWGGFVRLFAATHATGAVNSICHCVGTRRFDLKDDSRNVWWLAPVTFGESWHNGHHAFPACARHGLAWWEIDPAWLVILLMEKTGLAWNVVRVRPEWQSHHGQPADVGLEVTASASPD